MKLRLFSTTIVFAMIVMQSEAMDQASSGYNADGYTSSGDDDYDANDGSGNEEKAGKHNCKNCTISILFYHS